MSDGHFYYKQNHIADIADEVESIIAGNDNMTLGAWGEPIGHGYTPETIAHFRDAVLVLRTAYVYAQHIDWLLSCDDGEDSFRQRLVEELRNAKQASECQ